MGKKRWIGLGMLAAALATSPARAQGPTATAPGASAVPGAADPTAAGAPGAAGAAGAGAAAAPGFFKKCCQALEDCRRKLCASPAGQMLNSLTAPMSQFTGGVIPSFCPIMPSLADLAKPGVEGAAAMAKKDALEAKARRAAVRYMGTLDCRYYPEAEMALIAALRTDRIECVRFEAALAFANGCCCTRRVLEALEICVSGSERDGNPAERSMRVRDVAMIALERCVACFEEVVIFNEKKDKEKGKELPPPKELKKDGVVPVPQVTKDRELLERAKQTIADHHARGDSFVTSSGVALPKGQRSLFHILRYSTEGTTVAAPPAPAPQGIMRPVSRPVTGAPTPEPPATAPYPRVLPPQVKSAPAAQPAPVPPAVVIAPAPMAGDTELPARVETSTPPAEARPAQAPKAVNESPAAAPTLKVITPQTIDLPKTESLKIVTPQTIDLNPTTPPASEPMPINFQTKPTPAAARPEPTPAAARPEPTPAAVITKPTESAADAVTGIVNDVLTGSTAMERHKAIKAASRHDWKQNPQIVAGLVKAARLDSDRAVRVNAIRHMVTMKIDTPYVRDHLNFMVKDQDDWIREEATAALEKLGR